MSRANQALRRVECGAFGLANASAEQRHLSNEENRSLIQYILKYMLQPFDSRCMNLDRLHWSAMGVSQVVPNRGAGLILQM